MPILSSGNDDEADAKHATMITSIEASLLGSGHPIHGSNNYDGHYDSISDMWRDEGVLPRRCRGDDDDGDDDGWYQKAMDYWEDEGNCPATVDGVLGGFAELSPVDLEGSRDFIKEIAEIRPELKYGTACECGAGIGRVSKGLLFPIGFQRCHLIESSPRLISAAPEYIGDPFGSQCRFLCTRLQDFEPAPGSFDLIWIQWCIGYLNDIDYVPFLRRMGRSLRKGGIICLKDNTCTDEAFVVDKDDSSLTRSLPYHLALAEKAGLRVVMQKTQDNFPDDIFHVPMVAFEARAE